MNVHRIRLPQNEHAANRRFDEDINDPIPGPTYSPPLERLPFGADTPNPVARPSHENTARTAGAATIAGFSRTGIIVTRVRYLHLDVFAASPGGGNHLGVVLDAELWSDAAMQRFARWNNLVETTFVLAPTRQDTGYRVRIFTPHQEIAFASHPSIGSAHAVLESGLAQPRDGLIRQECGAGVLPVRVEGEGAARCLLLRPPPEQIVSTGLDAHPLLAATLHGVRLGRLPPALVEGGRKWWLAEIADEAGLRTWNPDHAAIGALARATDSMGLCAFARRTSADPAMVVRAFPAGVGITEDPASGAANGLIAAYLADAEPAGLFARGYVVSQGREVGHDAELIIRIEDGDIWVGGRTHTVVSGTLDWNTE